MADEPLLPVTPVEHNIASPEQPPGLVQTYFGDTQASFDEKYGRHPADPHPLKTYFRKCQKSFKCSKICVTTRLKRHLPVIDLIATYRFKKYILGDVLAGISLGILQVPQGLGYALLADVPPIVGLYTSFFPVLVYLIFGRSRHVAMGTMALTSLIIASAIAKVMPRLEAEYGVPWNMTTSMENNETNLTMSDTIEPNDMINQEKIYIATSMSFLAGIFLIGMSVLKLGKIATYISEPFMSGYLSGTNIHVLTHQLKHMLGLTVPGYSGTLGYFYMLRDILLSIPQTNVATLITSVVACLMLFIIKKFVNEKFSKQLKVPIPIDIIVVITATMLSYFCNFEGKFDMKIVNKIPQGLPYPSVPPTKYMGEFILESFVMALINYVLLFMMVKMFSEKHNYPYDANQEMLATGITGLVGSFFSSMAGSTSPPRCILGDQTGGQTQFAQLISATIILLTLLFLAPLLEALPICILASLILISCIPLFKYYIACIEYWRTSKHDLCVWATSLLGTLIFGVEAGILIGVSMSVVVVVLRTQRPYTSTLSVTTPDNKLVDCRKYCHKATHEQVTIFKYEAPLYFANLDLFKEKLFAVAPKPMSGKGKREPAVEMTVINNHEIKPEPNSFPHEPPSLRAVILDFSAVSFVDTSGAKLLASLHSQYDSVNVSLYFANVTETVRHTLALVKECARIVDVKEGCVYPSIPDALLAVQPVVNITD